ncbi:MAG: prepilin-type N-terminal cleavage/methylation domain-containing protein, partial [Planctomycetes bacterium]|nr:prepilin-type N-terminal cleavage/methylation domain-containing protein [Planctomycetota bacterium]
MRDDHSYQSLADRKPGRAGQVTAFTLVELLIVIAIIAVLIAML